MFPGECRRQSGLIAPRRSPARARLAPFVETTCKGAGYCGRAARRMTPARLVEVHLGCIASGDAANGPARRRRGQKPALAQAGDVRDVGSAPVGGGGRAEPERRMDVPSPVSVDPQDQVSGRVLERDRGRTGLTISPSTRIRSRGGSSARHWDRFPTHPEATSEAIEKLP